MHWQACARGAVPGGGADISRSTSDWDVAKERMFCYGMESSMLGICVYKTRTPEGIPDGPPGVICTGNLKSLGVRKCAGSEEGRRQLETHTGSTAMLVRSIRSAN
jgi:hypothetical protein